MIIVEPGRNDFRGHRGELTAIVKRILDVIPWDHGISAKEIGKKIDAPPNRIGIVIYHRLLHRVERRKDRETGRFLYKRLR